MYTIGIDLAITAAHKAIVAGAGGKFVTPLLSFHTRWCDIQQLVARIRKDVPSDVPMRAVMEPTGMVWFPVSIALRGLGVTPYLVSGQRTYDLRRYFKRHSSSDRVSARVLAKMPFVDEESLYPLEIPSSTQFACQRACKELDRVQTDIAAIKNRLRDTDRFSWPGLEEVFSNIFGPVARLFRETWYDPFRVVSAGVETVQETFLPLSEHENDLLWVKNLVDLASEVTKLYGPDALDYARLQEEVCREQEHLDYLEKRKASLWRDTIRPLYRQLHPSRNLETLYGVGELSGAVHASYIGNVERFPTSRRFRGWHGMIPDSRQSGEFESKGLHISQAGPDLIKKFSYIGADVARRYDPQIAAIYYDQIVNKGKHHKQAVCACATHFLDRVYLVLKEDRPYELRDVDGTAVTPEQARAIIAQRYTVPEEVRRRNNQRVRKERKERRVERRYKKRGKRSS
jgi:transposase